MALLRTRALELLQRIYRFGESQTFPEAVELAAPIQIVHDVGRRAELGAIEYDGRNGAFFQIGQDNVHAGATTIETTVDVYTSPPLPGNLAGPTLADLKDNVWVWLFYAWVSNATSTASLTSAQLSAGIDNLGSALAERDVPLAQVLTANMYQYHDPQVSGHAFGAPFQFPAGNLPMLLPQGTALGFRSVATGASTQRLSTICWVGPVGVYPPGFA